MGAPLLPDSRWHLIGPLLPAGPPKPKGGRPRVPDRQASTGILFVLKTICPWQALPKELGCGRRSTCWRRLRDWQRTGVWDRLHRLLLDCLGSRGRIDWSLSVLDSASTPAQKWGEETGPDSTDRGRTGTKYHLLVDRSGIPPAALISPANWHDSRKLEPLLDAVPPTKGLWGRPRKRPDKLHGDKGHSFGRCRAACRNRGVIPRIARRGVESSAHWQLEVTFEEARRHLGLETQRRWSDRAVQRPTPALLGLFALVTLLAHPHLATAADIRQAAWYHKSLPTFRGASAVVRRQLWQYVLSGTSPGADDIVKASQAVVDRLTDALSYTD